jgi:hypothetical protein
MGRGGGVGVAGDIGDEGSSIGSGGGDSGESRMISSSSGGCTRPSSGSTDSGEKDDGGGGGTSGSFESRGDGGVVIAVDVGEGCRWQGDLGERDLDRERERRGECEEGEDEGSTWILVLLLSVGMVSLRSKGVHA